MNATTAIIDGRFLDTPDKRGSNYEFYSSCGLDKYHGHHHHYPYRTSERRYLPNEFKKSKPPTFDGELKKLEDVEEWLLGMKKFLKLHDYIVNMKAMIAIFNLKGKVDI